MRFRLPPLNALRAFEAVARHMSFAKAAEELHLTPSALSYQIRSLEQHLGQPVFKRLNRAIELTPAGTALLPAVEDALQRIADTVARLSLKGSDRRLVVSTGPAFAAKWLAPRLHRFVDAHPEIELLISASLKLVDFAVEDVDVGIRFGLGQYPGLIAEPLLEVTCAPLCAPDVAAQLTTPADLARVLLLHDDSASALRGVPNWKTWLQAAGITGVDPNKGMRFNHAEHAIEAAIEGAGVVLGRLPLAARDLRQGRLVAPFALELPLEPQFFLVGPPEAFRTEKVEIFRAWLYEEAATTA